MAGSMKKNTQEMQRATSDPPAHPTATPAKRGAKQSTTISSTAEPDIVETTTPSTVEGRIPTTSPSTATDVLSREEEEKLLQRLRPDLNPSEALDTLTAGRPSSNPTQPAHIQPVALPSRVETDITEIGEGEDEWFDAPTGIEVIMGEKGEEEVYSGATEILSEGQTEAATTEMEVEKPGELNRGEEVEQPIYTERAVDEAEMVNTEVLDTVEVETNPTEGVEVHPIEEVGAIHTETTMHDVVVVTDGEDGSEKETPREMAGQKVSGRGDGLTENVVGASVRRRRLLVDEDSEEEEKDVFFQPIGGRIVRGAPRARNFWFIKRGKLGKPQIKMIEREGKGKGRGKKLLIRQGRR